MITSPKRKSYCPPTPTSPISPSLKPPETTLPQSKIDKVHSTFCGVSKSNLHHLPPQARSPSLLVLDLEENLFQSSALQKLPKNLSILNLVNNPLKNMNLPMLPLLRSLSLDNCGLTSFEGFPQLQQLRFLSVSNNKLTNFKGLPILMRLEYFNISNNPIKFGSKLSIAAIGSISLNMFNDVELTENELEEAFQLSPLVGFSLRCGRDATPCESPDEEVRKSQKFLTAKLASYLESKEIENPTLSLNICKFENQSSVICPFETKSIKWLRSRSPEHGTEWVAIPQTPEQKQPNILPITMLLRMHLIRCDFVLDDNNTYSLFTDQPIGRSSEDLSLPFPLDPVIAGLPLEGSLISLIPLPIPARVAWMRKNDVIGENTTSLLLSNKEIGSAITCLLQPYCPNYPDVAFSTVFVETDVVDPILPTVSGVTFPESLQEGVKIEFTRKMFPDREGESQILVERARGITEEWFVVAELKPDGFSYIPTCDDAGHYLRVSYAPVTTEGVIGQTIYFYSSTRVLPTLPVFTNAVIGGLPKTNFTLCAVADYKGGRKGHCCYNWYSSTVPITAQNIKSLPLVEKDCPFFTIPDDYENYFLACEMVPVREDDVVGEAVYAALNDPIIKDEEPAIFEEEIPEVIRAGDKLAFNSQVSFYVSSTKGFCGFTEVKRGTNVTLKDNWVGHILRIVTNESDFVVGEIQPSIPEIKEITISCPKLELGEVATLDIKSKNLKKDRFDTIWVRCMNEGLEKAVAYNTPDYALQAADLGYRLKVMVTTYDDNHDFLATYFSPLTGVVRSTYHNAPIIVGDLSEFSTISVEYDKEMDQIEWLRSDTTQRWEDTKQTGIEYKLTSADINHYMRAQIHIGESTLIATTNDVIRASKPVAKVRFTTDDATEGQQMTPIIEYKGGVEGKSITEWKLFVNKWKTVSTEANYKVSKDDVGFKLVFNYTPVRNDNVKGEKVTKDFGIVNGLPPTVTDVTVKQNDRGFIECTGKYSGGVEGPSYYLWHAIDRDGKLHNIGKTEDCEIFPPEKLFGLEVETTYCPIRKDGVEGDQVRSSNKVLVRPLPSITSIDILVKDGIVRVGQVLRCKVTTNPEDCKIGYQWYRGDGQSQWEAIPKATRIDYRPTELDTGYFVLCLAAPTNSEGWVGKGISAATPIPVEPSEMELIIIPETTPATNKEKYWTGANLKTNLKGEIVTWEREVHPGEWAIVGNYETYPIAANDVGCRIRAAIDDYESSPTPAIITSPEVGSFVNATVRARSFQFKAESKMGSVKWEFLADENGLTMKSKRGKNQKTSKWTSVSVRGIDGQREEVELWMDATTKFVIIPLIQGDPNFKALVQKNASDFLILTLQGFISKYGTTET